MRATSGPSATLGRVGFLLCVLAIWAVLVPIVPLYIRATGHSVRSQDVHVVVTIVALLWGAGHLAVFARRLRDMGASGLWGILLLMIYPLAVLLLALVPADASRPVEL